MQVISVDDVIIPENRQRTEFNDLHLSDTAKSIESKGLFHAIVLRNDKRTLVAGECRLRSITRLYAEGKSFSHNGEAVPVGTIPFVTLADLDAFQLEEAEFEENVRRMDLTLQERAQAIARLHKLRISQHGEYDPSSKEGWTKTDTAQELHRRAPKKNEINDISIDLLIAENLDDPFVAAAKDKREALRAIRERKSAEHRANLLAEFNASKTSHNLILGSSYKEFSKAEYAGRFSVIVTDPPYGIDAQDMTTHDAQKHEYEDDEEAFQQVLKLLPNLSYQITQDAAHIYVFCDIERFQELFLAFEISPWTPWPRPIIWNKGNIGSYGGIDKGFRKTYDAILFANKGGRTMNGGYRDVININQRTDLPHPAGKPAELYQEILSYSVLPGDEVADFYCGHGPIFAAADALHCVATGVEKNPKYHAMAVETISKLGVK